MTNENLDDKVAELLRVASQRYTAGRRRLVAALQQGNGPLTINQIVQVDSTLPQSTIYRNLTVLEDAGVVSRIVTNDDFARYELAECLTGHHHHLICTECGDIEDFELDTRIENTLHRSLEQAAATADFAASNHRLDLLGTCTNCR